MTLEPRDTPAESADSAEWRSVLLGTDPKFNRYARIMRRMPGAPRCHFCGAPFTGIGSPLARLMGSRRWERNPNYCARCFTILDQHRGGAEIPCSLLFADIRGSTALAERMSPSDFRAKVQRFYSTAADVLFRHEAILDKFVGDEVMALFIPALTGERHAARALDTGRDLLRATGHSDPGGPWVPVGVGVATGIAFVGSVADPPATTFTALGDVVNVAARLASAAGEGELLVTLEAAEAAPLGAEQVATLERRDLDLKGKAAPVPVLVLAAGGGGVVADR
jgi:adenylate cyclase